MASVGQRHHHLLKEDGNNDIINIKYSDTLIDIIIDN
jgi:hypothetical protein